MKFAGNKLMLNMLYTGKPSQVYPFTFFSITFSSWISFSVACFHYLEFLVLIYLLPPFNILSCRKDLHRHLLLLHLYTLPKGKIN